MEKLDGQGDNMNLGFVDGMELLLLEIGEL
jgi:hypothetical protein